MKYVFTKNYHHCDLMCEIGWVFDYDIERNTFRVGDFILYVKDSEIGELLDSSKICRFRKAKRSDLE